MNNLYLFTAIFLLVVTLMLAFSQLRKNLKQRDWSIFFWGGAIYFALYPMLMDSILLLNGSLESSNKFILDDNPNYWDGVTSDILFSLSFFIFSFCIIFHFTDTYFRKKFKKTIRPEFAFKGPILLFLFIVSALPCYLILSEGADFIYNQKNEIQLSALATYSGVFAPLGAVIGYNLLRRRKYILAILFVLPLVVLAVVGQSRTLFFYVPSAFLMGFIASSKKTPKISVLIISAIALLLLSQVVKIISNPNYGFLESDNKVSFIATKIFRDGSVGDLYYSYYIRDQDPHLTTSGESTKALVLTGIVPPFLDRTLFLPENTVTYRIYQLRFGDVDFGSMHPTLFGDAYFDLGYWGLVLAFFIAFILRFYEFFMSKFIFSSAIAPVMIVGFLFIAMRGSVNVSYFRLVYGGVVMFIIMYFAYASQKSITRQS